MKILSLLSEWMMIKLPVINNFVWRLGRSVYMYARGEERYGDIGRNGEAFLQSCVLKNGLVDETLVIMDIGANQGEWTESFLRLLSVERRNPDYVNLHTFEPVPSTATMLQNRISKLPGKDIVQHHELAMSEGPGHAEIGVFAAGLGTNSIHHEADARTPENVIQVELTSLDAFCELYCIEHVHLAKCDTEGHDSKVLMGARSLLQSERIDVLQFEYNHRWVFGRAFLKDAFDLIDGLPYNVARLNENGLTFYEYWHPELERFFQSNYVLVHERAQNWFPAKRGRFNSANVYTQRAL